MVGLAIATGMFAPEAARGDAGGFVPRRSPTLIASRVTAPPVLDGKLDDPVWQGATLDAGFTQNFPDEGKPASERTELRVVYDDDAIYVAVHCLDSQPQDIVARLTRRDRDIDADKVTIDISSKNDKASAYHFQVNAAGIQLDGVRFNDTDYNGDWDGRWYAVTAREPDGWTAELKIPLVTLRYSGDASTFGFQVRRYLHRREEVDEWAYVPRTARGEVSYYGTLDGIVGLRAKRLLDVLAYYARRYTIRSGQGPLDGGAGAGSLGADLKLGVTPALTLDGTINPDFGTVEVDQVILNLSTIETYYPEKRPFFLEGADLFATPFKLFYSRRVGATPPSPTLGDGETLVEPVPGGGIWGALKLTGLVTSRLSVGVLDAVTSREDATIARTPGGAPENLLVEPLSNFAVLRLRQEFGTNSSVGVLATGVTRFEPANAAAPRPTDVCPVPYSTTFTSLVAPPARAGRCTNDAYTAGLDTVLRTSDGDWGASAQIVGSRIEQGPPRLIPDGVQIGPGATGWGVISEAGRYGGKNWLYKIGYSNASPRLQINDAGYQGQANFHDAFASVTWRTTRPSGRVLSASVEALLEVHRDWTLDDNQFTDPHVAANVQLDNFWSLSTLVTPYFPRSVDNRETQDGARTERGAGYFANFEVKTDPRQPLVVDLSGATRRNYGGETGWFVSAMLSLRPIPALELDLIPNVEWTYGTPRWVDTEPNPDGSRTYYFSQLDARSFDVTLRGTYTFTRTLSLQAYVQPFVASGHYGATTASTAAGARPLLGLGSFVPATLPAGVTPDFRDGEINVNLFARWEYLPLSALWLVFTHNQQQTPYDPMEGPARIRIGRFAHGPTTDVALIKLSYLWF